MVLKQMSALVKLSLSSRIVNYLHLSLQEETTVRNTSTGMGLEFAGCSIVKASGEDAGQMIEDGIVRANQRVFLQLGSISPNKYQAMLEINPKLYLYGVAQLARIVEPGDKTDIVIVFRADKQVDVLKDMPWLVRIYMVD